MSRFPVMFRTVRGHQRRETVPWALVAPHEGQARLNHGGQSLARLAERGGLSPGELLAVLEGRPWRLVPEDEAWARVLERAASTE